VIYIYWILVISGICAIVGFYTFLVEAFSGRIQRFTPWSELNHYQMEVAVLTIVGTTVFVGTLIVGAILKYHQLIG
jgi:ABC-type transport system involved in cytochrome c biogenesis permease subunit